MKRTTTLLSSLVIALGMLATDHVINISGLTYTPANIVVNIGDNVTIGASNSHPLLEVSEDTWNSDGGTALAGGFGPETSDFTFEVTEPGNIYFICTSHIQFGMKGSIEVSTTSVDELSNEINVNLGQLPVTDGILDYSIEGAEGLVQSVEVYSVTGSMILQEAVDSRKGSLRLDVRSGIYIIMMKDRNGEAVFRDQINVR